MLLICHYSLLTTHYSPLTKGAADTLPRVLLARTSVAAVRPFGTSRSVKTILDWGALRGRREGGTVAEGTALAGNGCARSLATEAATPARFAGCAAFNVLEAPRKAFSALFLGLLVVVRASRTPRRASASDRAHGPGGTGKTVLNFRHYRQ